jgi:TetR/AcrR family acrAB operon transcriptional repressor
MGKKTKAEAEKTRECLLDAAERVFCSRGVSRTALAEVAEAAAMTRGAIYWHFKNKKDVFHALHERATHPVYQRFEEEAMLAAADPIGQLRDSVSFCLADLTENERSQRMLEILLYKCEYVEEMSEVLDELEKNKAWFTERVKAQIERGRQLGLVDQDLSPDMATVGLHSFITGLMREWLRKPESFDLRKAAPDLVARFFRGWGYRPAGVDVGEAADINSPR